MKLNEKELAILDGQYGLPRKHALEHQIEVGKFFDAKDMVKVGHVHIMADTEALGLSGVKFLEKIADEPFDDRKVIVPTITDPRGSDFTSYKKINQRYEYVELEKRTVKAFKKLDVMMTDTCINYQVFMPPVLGEHLAFGDTGSCIYANSVLGARTNYEGGPSALAAALTGRTPRYGFHLEENRLGNNNVIVSCKLSSYSDWGALGGMIGQEMLSYWDVPVIYGLENTPSSDELKHFGAALASFGSTPMFHIEGITPETYKNNKKFNKTKLAFNNNDLKNFYKRFSPKDESLDVVVFAAPQLSLNEMKKLSKLLEGRVVDPKITLIVCTAPSVKALCDKNNITKILEKSGAIVLEGVCFYNMHAKEIAEANGWKRLMSNSAKLINILGGYGYETILNDMENCINSACSGKVVL